MAADNETVAWMNKDCIEEDFAYFRKIARERDTSKLEERRHRMIAEYNHNEVETARQKALKRHRRNKHGMMPQLR